MSEALNAVVKSLRAREKLGLKKYGTTVDREDLTLSQWLRHLQHELMDGAMYLEPAIKAAEKMERAEKRRLKK